MIGVEEKLKHAGLSGNKAKVYLELIRRGSMNGSELSKKAGLDRTVTYQVLNNLVEEGLVNYIIKDHKKYFSSSEPRNLLRPIKEQEELVQTLVIELEKIKKFKEAEQSVEVYEGKAGLNVLFEEILNCNEFCFFGSTGKSYDVLKWKMERIERELIKKGIKGRGISSNKMRGTRMTDVKNLEMKFIEGGESKDTSYGILDKKTITIHCLAQEKPIVVIIKNEFMAQTLQNYFEFMWQQAKS